MTKLFLTLICTVGYFSAYSQSLPDKQLLSVPAPGNVKIDGKTNELNDKFEAYNKNTDIYYTLYNDRKSLYLTIQTNIEEVINRISGGGITFKVKKQNDSKASGVAFTYPAIEEKATVIFLINPKKGVKPDTSIKVKESTMVANNKTLSEHYKWIKVSGIRGVDTLSIYNEKNIAANAKFDLKKALTLELSVPIILLKDLIGTNQILFYEIIVNGRKSFVNPFFAIGNGPEAAKTNDYIKNIAAQLNAKLTAVTNFSGEYTLAQ